MYTECSKSIDVSFKWRVNYSGYNLRVCMSSKPWYFTQKAEAGIGCAGAGTEIGESSEDSQGVLHRRQRKQEDGR